MSAATRRNEVSKSTNRRSRRPAVAVASEAMTSTSASTPTTTSPTSALASASIHQNRDAQGWQEVGSRGKTRNLPGTRRQQQGRTSNAPKPSPSAPTDIRRTNSPVSKKGIKSGCGGSSTSSRASSSIARRNTPPLPARKATRREYTLFEHLFMKNATFSMSPPSRTSDVDRPPGAIGGTPNHQSRGGKIGVSQPSQMPKGRNSSSPPSPPSTTGTIAKGRSETPQRRPASRQPRGGAAVSGAEAATFQQPVRGGVHIASGGECLKVAVPSPFSSVKQRGCHVSSSRRMIKSEDVPKPGKQRLGPRKKNLSTLKKRILLDRLERWRDIQREEPPASPPACAQGQDAGEKNARLSLSPDHSGASLSSPSSSAVTPCGDDIDEFGSGGSGTSGQRLWTVTIYNLVDEQDIEDDDDQAEVERDLWEMASTYGVVRSIDIPRSAAQFKGSESAGATGAAAAVPVKAAFATIDEAQRAREGFEGRIVGGKALLVEIDVDVNFGGSTPPNNKTKRSAPAPAGRSLWRVAVENLIDEEDNLDDEDDFAEVYADVSAMMGVHGTLIAVHIPRQRRKSEKGVDSDDKHGDVETFKAMEPAWQVVVVTFGSLVEAQACVEGTKGRMVGGKALDAKLLTGSVEGEHERREDTSAIGTTAAQPPSPSPGDNTASSAEADGSKSIWRVVIRNLIDEDDLRDDDDYGEVLADITTLISAYGAVAGLYIPRNRKEQGVATEGADSSHDRAELGEAIAVYGSLEEAEACAQGLSGRTIGGKALHAQVLTNGNLQLSQREREPPGVETAGGGTGQGQGGPLQREGALEAVPEVHCSRFGLLPGVVTIGAGNRDDARIEIAATVLQGPPGAAVAAKQASGGDTRPASTEKGKRVQNKYKEAVALPKPPGISGGGSPNAYVNQSPDQEVNDLVFEMLQLLFKFQERARLSDPAKAKTRRRIVMGLREVLRGVKAKKVRLLVVAPNVDAVGGQGGLDEKVVEIIDTAREGDTPVVFALSKRKIGKALGKTIKVSAVGVYSFDGAHEQQKKLTRRMEIIHALPPPALPPPESTEVVLRSPPAACADSEKAGGERQGV